MTKPDISTEAVAKAVEVFMNATLAESDDARIADMLEALAADRYRLASELAQAKVDLGVEASLRRAVAVERDQFMEQASLRDGRDAEMQSLMAINNKLVAEREESETVLAECYQAVGVLGETMGLSDNEDFIRLQDILAYGETKDGKPLLPFPLIPNIRAETAERERDLLIEQLSVRDGRPKGDTETGPTYRDLWNASIEMSIEDMRGMKTKLDEAKQALAEANAELARLREAHPKVDALVEAVWQVLDDMGANSCSTCLASKALLRAAYEPFWDEELGEMDYPLEEARRVLVDVGLDTEPTSPLTTQTSPRTADATTPPPHADTQP